jgi:hypothetical protein
MGCNDFWKELAHAEPKLLMSSRSRARLIVRVIWWREEKALPDYPAKRKRRPKASAPNVI